MVYNSSDYNYDFALEKLKEEKLGFVLFKETANVSLLSVIESKTKYDEKQDICLGNPIQVYVVPTKYNEKTDKNLNYRVNCRDFAITLLYERWCKYNEKKIKSPYVSKTFMQYISNIELLKCDYVVFLVDWKEKETTIKELI